MNRWTGWGIVGVFCLLHACSAMQPQKQAPPSEISLQITALNQKLDQANHRISVLQYMVDDHQESIKRLEQAARPLPAEPLFPVDIRQRTAPPREKTPPAVDTNPQAVPSETAEALYNQALSAYQAHDYKKALALFGSVAENYPGHDLADNALYWSGECLYTQKDYKGAIRTFTQVVEKYPKGSKVSDALLKTGYAYLALDDPVNAQSFLKKVVTQYPFTPAGAKAGEMLQKMKPK